MGTRERRGVGGRGESSQVDALAGGHASSMAGARGTIPTSLCLKSSSFLKVLWKLSSGDRWAGRDKLGMRPAGSWRQITDETNRQARQ